MGRLKKWYNRTRHFQDAFPCSWENVWRPAPWPCGVPLAGEASARQASVPGGGWRGSRGKPNLTKGLTRSFPSLYTRSVTPVITYSVLLSHPKRVQARTAKPKARLSKKKQRSQNFVVRKPQFKPINMILPPLLELNIISYNYEIWDNSFENSLVIM